MKVAVLLARNPVTLRRLTPFETAYLQHRDALALGSAKGFAHEHFFKRGSLLQTKWLALHARLPHSTPAKPALAASAAAAAAEDEFAAALAEIAAAQPLLAARDTDVTSLDRRLPDPLFLVVKSAATGVWELPAAARQGKDLLHEAAKRSIEETCGTKMETWMVGKIPVGHIVKSDKDKTFIMKHLILSGQVVLNPKLVSDHAWLTKSEMAERLDKEYFESIQDIL
ncbi:hypothetical protein BDR26DRAFT_1008678 [Obelidium mucronatum]|nr:hypothetical protein BDR26DRAFT_1008678 [Obelidium mucronatum]